MTPETLLELGKVFGLPGAFLLYMWVNRNPAPKSEGDPAKQLLAKLDEIDREVKDSKRQNNDIENRVIALDTKVEVLLDRRK